MSNLLTAEKEQHLKMKVKEVIELALARGFEYKGTNGDHRIYHKEGVGIIVIPGKLSDDIPTGLGKSLLKKINS